MTVSELRKLLQYYDNNAEVRFRDPVRGKAWPLEAVLETETVWESIHDEYNGLTGQAGHTAVVLVKKDN